MGMLQYEQMMVYGHGLGPVDLDGNPVTRTKSSHPYSYDGHVILRAQPNNKPKMTAVYTDRMQQWDGGKYCRLLQKHGISRWQAASPRSIVEFLRDWYDDPGVALVAVMEWCNWASGYPTWSLHFIPGADTDAEQEADA